VFEEDGLGGRVTHRWTFLWWSSETN